MINEIVWKLKIEANLPQIISTLLFVVPKINNISSAKAIIVRTRVQSSKSFKNETKQTFKQRWQFSKLFVMIHLNASSIKQDYDGKKLKLPIHLLLSNEVN